MKLAVDVAHTDGRARAGTMWTPHGVVATPVFMPVGTRGSVVGLTSGDLERLGVQVVLTGMLQDLRVAFY